VTGHAKARNLPNGRLSLLDVKTGSIAFDRLAYLIAILETLPEAVAVGTLASALADELNQPLKAMANYVSAGRDLLDDEPPSNREAIREAPDEAAIEAMEHVSTKQLTIRARQRSAEQVEISVADSGSGVAPELLENLFQPFTGIKLRAWALACRSVAP
jgi:phosphoglycerate-specific signal transduction histidine kinase